MVSLRGGLGVASGLAVATIYLAVAVWAGRTGPLVRRPLFDGFAPPPPYRWVSPPPSLASQNQTPASGRFEVDLNPQTGSQATVLSTDDNQASLALDDGTISPVPRQGSAIVTIVPLAAEGFGPAPAGLEVAGNVYRIQAAYRPSQEQIVRMAKSAQVVLAYPAEPGTIRHRHSLLVSEDGRAWTAVTATDSHFQLLIQASVASFGYFAVGRTPGGAPTGGGGVGTIVIYGLVGLAILAIGLVILRTELRLRRQRRRSPGGRRPRPDRATRKRRAERERRSRRDLSD
jgi:hypothetical protein